MTDYFSRSNPMLITPQSTSHRPVTRQPQQFGFKLSPKAEAYLTDIVNGYYPPDGYYHPDNHYHRLNYTA